MAPRYRPMVNSVEDISSTQRPIFMVQKYTSFDTALLVLFIVETNKKLI